MIDISLYIYLAAGKSRFGSFLSRGHSPGKTDKLYMKGPGGRGEVEVAVCVCGKSKFLLLNFFCQIYICLNRRDNFG